MCSLLSCADYRCRLFCSSTVRGENCRYVSCSLGGADAEKRSNRHSRLCAKAEGKRRSAQRAAVSGPFSPDPVHYIAYMRIHSAVTSSQISAAGVQVSLTREAAHLLRSYDGQVAGDQGYLTR